MWIKKQVNIGENIGKKSIDPKKRVEAQGIQKD